MSSQNHAGGSPPNNSLSASATALLRRDRKRLIAVFVLVALALAITGSVYIHRQQEEAQRAANERLAAIADLKLRQITNWRQERLSDARFFSRAPFVAADLERLIQNPSQTDRDAVLRWLKLLKGGDRYDEVALFDSQLKPLISIPPKAAVPTESHRSLMAQILKDKEIAMSDLNQETNGLIHLQILFPIFRDPDRQEGLLGYGYLNLDARQFLFPLLQAWPTASRTAETMLVRREDNEVLYLSPLLKQPEAAMRLRIPLSSQFPAARVLQDETNFIESLDYGGTPVVAVGHRIPGTSWAMVVKVDREELYAPLRRQTLAASLIFGSFLLIGALLTALLWWRRGNEFLLRELAMERERLAERKGYEDELRHLNAELEQRVRKRTAQLEAKNRALESFTYSVSHDLKAPLRGIAGFAQVLVEDHLERLGDDGKECVQTIIHSAERMNQLIDDLLSYSRLEIQKPEFSVVNTRDLINKILKDFAPQIASAKTQISVQIEAPTLQTDPQGLEQALRNLIGNAIKFSAKAPQPSVHISGRDKDNLFTLEVRDNGVGFDMQYQDKLFQIFQRLHPANQYAGTGIGLAIVRKAVERVGGTVHAQSEPGKGACFSIQIPHPKKIAKPVAPLVAARACVSPQTATPCEGSAALRPN